MVLSTEQIQYVGKEIALFSPLKGDQLECWKSLALIRWLFGGNQSGKTYNNMMDLAQLVLNVHPYRQCVPGVHWVAIETWDMCRDILWEGYLEKMIPAHHIIGNIQYGPNRVPRKITLDTNHIIEFKSFREGRAIFQGRSIQSAHYDEQCLRDFQGILNETQARLIANKGTLSWSMTPIMPQSLLEERIENLPATDEMFHFNLNDNRKSQGGYINDESIDNMIDDWPEEVQATRIEGLFASYYGAVYKTFNRKTHVIYPFKIPADWSLYRGIDFGYTNPFVCLWMAKDKDENWYVYREYYKTKTGIQEHIVNIKARSAHEKYAATFADTEDPEKIYIDLRNAGIKAIGARKDVDRGIELVQSKFKVKKNGKPSLYIFNTCPNTAREHAMYQHSQGTSSRESDNSVVKKDDHTCDALRYILYSVERPRKKGTVLAA